MKKLILILFLSLFLVGCGGFSSPTTTEPIVIDTENYLEINNVEDLKSMEMNKSYILMVDLDLIAEEWIPVGTFTEPFLGNFDGNNKTISNLSITKDNQYNGLFGYLKGDVFDLTIKDFNIDLDTKYVSLAGGLAGALSGDVTNVKVNGDITINNTRSNVYAGILAGMSEKYTDLYDMTGFVPNIIDNNISEGSINIISEKYAFIGGLFGKSYNSSITNNQTNTTIDVVNNANIAYVGGLVGHNYSGLRSSFEQDPIAEQIIIKQNISRTVINVESKTHNASVGGFIGYSYYGNISDNFSSSNISVEALIAYASLNIGEQWYGSFENMVAQGNITLINENADNKISPYIGKAFTNINILNSYFESQNQEFSEEKNQVSTSDLASYNWFVSSLEWEAEFINKIINND